MTGTTTTTKTIGKALASAVRPVLEGIAHRRQAEETPCTNPDCDGYGHVLTEGKAEFCECHLRRVRERSREDYLATVETVSGSKREEVEQVRRDFGLAPAVLRKLRAEKAKNPTLNSVLISGPPGIGKTSVGHLLALISAGKGKRARYANAAVFAAAYSRLTRDDGCANYVERVEDWAADPTTVLFLDDLGAERSGSNAVEKIVEIVTYRFESRASTILTTNLSIPKGELSAQYGHVLDSRLTTDSRWICVISFSGANRNLRLSSVRQAQESRCSRVNRV